MVAAHKQHPAILMWCIGNELNADYSGKLPHLFALIEEMAAQAHAEEGSNHHPVTTALADVDLIHTISTYDSKVPSLDIWGANVYRGKTFGDLFMTYKNVSHKPLSILEYGIDAYDHIHGVEYENIGKPQQALYAEALWDKITKNSDICIGGSILAYSDEWWRGKHSTGPGCPENSPNVHGTCGYSTSSSPDGYSDEKWWGVMRTLDNANSPDIMEPRAAYYKLQALWTGFQAQINVSPLTIDFGNVTVNSSSPPRTITISNTGNKELIIRSLKVLEGDGSLFKLTTGTCANLTPIIAAGASCTINVVFSPVSAGKITTTLKIISNDPDTPRTEISLSGTGIQPKNFRVSGGAYNSPDDPKYKATFSMDVTGPASLGGWLKYYYAKTRMDVASNGITTVSVSGNTATISGTGPVNGVGGYSFTATITDGSPDSFGITIKNSKGSVYYSAGSKKVSGGDIIISNQ